MLTKVHRKTALKTHPIFLRPEDPVVERLISKKLLTNKQQLLQNIKNTNDPTSIFDHIKKRLLIEETIIHPADAIIIFGNRHIAKKLAQKAADLYFSNNASLIIASGGRAEENGGISESQKIKQALIDLNIPDTAIKTDEQSTNTENNVLNSMSLIQKTINRKPSAIIGVGTIVAGRRFLATFNRHCKDAVPMASNVNPFETKLDEWHTNSTFKNVVLNEYCKLEVYSNFGWIRDININDLNQRIVAASHVKNSCVTTQNRAYSIS